MLTAEQAAARYNSGMTGSGAKQKYIEGVNAVTESPMEKAAAAEDLYLRRVEEASRSGKRANNLRAVSLSTWKQKAAGKGADRLASGATAAMDKVRAHFQKWMPIYGQASAAAKAIPKDGTIENAVARQRAAMEVLMRAANRSV